MTARNAPRGKPLVALLLVLGGWIAVRALLWDLPLLAPGGHPADAIATMPDRGVADRGAADRPMRAAPAEPEREGPADARPVAPPAWPAFVPARPMPAPRPSATARPARDSLAPRFPASAFAVPSYRVAEVPARIAAGHQLLWMAVMGRMPVPAALLAAAPRDSLAVPFHAAGRGPARPKRWSADGWLLLREGGGAALATGAAPASYGASQAGAVLRYRLAPESAHRPAAYLRATAALNGSREREAALGLSARPFADVPVILAAELRATDRPRGTRPRPAAMAVTELPPFELPAGFRGEVYAQAGYVGGGFATAFADGQLRADRAVAQLGKGELRAGAGAWGGAQKGASRLDVGPGATMGLGLGGSGSARLALDWRFRVAGDAAPASGPALTLSAGF